MLPQFGIEGQEKLKTASVLLVGAGGLGSPVMLYLAAAGVGTIGIVDFDVVDPTNLHRQIVYKTSDVGRLKTEASKELLLEMNPFISVHEHPFKLTADNALALFEQYDVILDGSDNFATRYLVNDACVLTGKPNVFASIFRFDGQVAIFGAENGPCYRCVFPEPPPPGSVPSCAEGGVLGVLPGIVGTIQAAETLKLITGIGSTLIGKMLLIDVLDLSTKKLSIQKDPECSICGERPSLSALIDYDLFCGVEQPTDQSTTAEPTHTLTNESMFFGSLVPSITVFDLVEKRKSSEEFLLLDVRQAEELSIADIGGTLMPMDQLAHNMDALSAHKDHDIIVMCRTGSRSVYVVEWLQKQGFERVYNLEGGIAAWSRHIDSTIPLY